MHAGEFAKKRAKIERRAGGRMAFMRKAMAHLAREADARPVRVKGKLVGWCMQSGGVVCVKERYRCEEDASEDLERIRRQSRHEYVPVRVYRCQWCSGWHLTSKLRD